VAFSVNKVTFKLAEGFITGVTKSYRHHNCLNDAKIGKAFYELTDLVQEFLKSEDYQVLQHEVLQVDEQKMNNK